jgi:hypothetical protein
LTGVYKHQTPAITAKNNHKNAGTRFVDLNGDGLVDVITSRPIHKTNTSIFVATG